MLRAEEKKLELIVGFVVIAIVILALMGVAWGNKNDIFTSRKIYTIRFDRASGLDEGNPVTVAGVPKGTVQDFIVGQDSVDVIIAMDKDIQLKIDATAIIASAELIGGKKIEVYPGESEIILHEKGLFRGRFTGGLDDIFETVGSITTDLNRLMKTLNKTFINVNMLMETDIQATIKDTKHSIFELDSLITSDIKPMLGSLKRTMSSAEKVVKKADGIVDQNKDSIATIVKNLTTFSKSMDNLVLDNKIKFKNAVTNLESVSKDLTDFSAQLKNKNSTLSKLMTQDTLYTRLDTISANLNSLIADIKANPKKYLEHVNIKVDMFGGKE